MHCCLYYYSLPFFVNMHLSVFAEKRKLFCVSMSCWIANVKEGFVRFGNSCFSIEFFEEIVFQLHIVGFIFMFYESHFTVSFFLLILFQFHHLCFGLLIFLSDIFGSPIGIYVYNRIQFIIKYAVFNFKKLIHTIVNSRARMLNKG